MRRRHLAGLLGALLAGSALAQASDPWPALAQPGAVLLVRHALAPGVGDPPGMRIGDCATQRNLSDDGRAQARRLGELLRGRGVQVGAVWTSQWCRTRETARLAFPQAAVRDETAFNSFFQQGSAAADAQTARARALLADWRGPGTLVVVTHQVNITALTGLGASSGEGVVLRRGPDGAPQVAGTLQP